MNMTNNSRLVLYYYTYTKNNICATLQQHLAVLLVISTCTLLWADTKRVKTLIIIVILHWNGCIQKEIKVLVPLPLNTMYITIYTSKTTTKQQIEFLHVTNRKTICYISEKWQWHWDLSYKKRNTEELSQRRIYYSKTFSS